MGTPSHMQIITPPTDRSNALRRWTTIAMTCLGILIVLSSSWTGPTISLGPLEVNVNLLRFLGLIAIGLIARFAFRDRAFPSSSSRMQVQIPLGMSMSGVDTTEMTHHVEVKLSELLNKYQTMDLNDSRVQEELKSYVQTLSTNTESK